MQALDKLVLVIAEIIAAHCAGTRAREEFIKACLHAQWAEAEAMVEGMLAEPWHLVGYQESRLREFLELLRAAQTNLRKRACSTFGALRPAPSSSSIQSEAATWRNFYIVGAKELWEGVPDLEAAVGTHSRPDQELMATKFK